MHRTSRSQALDPLVARWVMAGAAFAVAAFIMVFYVQLLHESVARGAQWRYGQSTMTSAATESSTNASVRLIGATR